MKKLINSIFSIVILIAICILNSFQKSELVYTDYTDEKLPPLVAKELDRKINIFKENILKKCKENALLEAELFVDSIVSEQIKNLTGDRRTFPKIPKKPELNKNIILDDSTAIKPILDN